MQQNKMKKTRIANFLAIVGLLLIVAGVVFWVTNQDSGGIEVVVPTPSPLVVQVTGEVNVPGIYELSRGSRVGDLINAADGTTLRADTDGLNFAKPLEDGEHVKIAAVPTPTPVPVVIVTPADPNGENALPAVAADPGESKDEGGLIDLNTADLEGLTKLNGIGPATAEKIIVWRAGRTAPIDSVDELTQVSGIGEKTVDGLREQVIQQ